MQTLQQLKSGQLRGSKRIKLSCCLTTFPEEIFTLAETLEILDLSGNKLSQLPADFGRLKNLKIAFFSDNLFTEFPAQLAACEKLEMIGFKANKIAHLPENALPEKVRWLILTDNCLTKLPDSIGENTRLQKVALAGNQLETLPDSMANCRNLELLRISANQLAVFPEWLLSLPRLAWLAFAGNPCSRTITEQAALPEISWNSMEIHEKLGEGASGFIWKASFKPGFKNDFPEEVAVKIFKGTVTSDGFPEDEMNAHIAAGIHPNLVSVIGKIKEHPEEKNGLVLNLIPPQYRNLGNPPSFQTCTRDTFPDKTTFTLPQLLTVVKGIASAAAQLHAQGCMHGDLYAHNILIDSEANPIFGDFGAATLYDKNVPAAEALEKLEVLAFGNLLEDLTTRLAEAEKETKAEDLLQNLMEECLQPEVSDRPFFREINTVLAQL